MPLFCHVGVGVWGCFGGVFWGGEEKFGSELDTSKSGGAQKAGFVREKCGFCRGKLSGGAQIVIAALSACDESGGNDVRAPDEDGFDLG